MPRAKSLSLEPRLKIWFESGGEYAFGYGLCEMLEAVQNTGSIKEAASAIGKSYRHVWGRIKAAETILKRPLVETRVGGKSDHRSELTQEATRLLKEFLTLRQTMKDVLAREFQFAFQSILTDAKGVLKP